MNITELHSLCKALSRKVFEDAKHCLVNHPFVDKAIDEALIEDVIHFQIKQELGRSILKKFIKNNSFDTPNQLKVVAKITKNYERLVIDAFYKYAKKHVV